MVEWVYLVLEYCRDAKAETNFFFVAVDSTDPDAKILYLGSEASAREGCWREYHLVPKRTWVLGVRRTDGETCFEDFWIEEDTLITHALELIPLSHRRWHHGVEAEVHQPNNQ